jgi:hypothetical protein
MKRLNNYSIKEVWIEGHYNSTPAIIFNGDEYVLGAGTSDNIIVYHDKDNVYVVVENHNLNYIGLEVFEKSTGEKLGEFFDQANEMGYLNMKRYPTKIRLMSQHID